MSIKKSIVYIQKCQLCQNCPATKRCEDCNINEQELCYQCDELKHKFDFQEHKREIIHHSSRIQKSSSHYNLPRQIMSSGLKPEHIVAHSEAKVYFKESTNQTQKESAENKLFDQGANGQTQPQKELQNQDFQHNSNFKNSQEKRGTDQKHSQFNVKPKQFEVLDQQIENDENKNCFGLAQQFKDSEIQLGKYQQILGVVEKNYEDNLSKLHQKLLESEKFLLKERSDKQMEIRQVTKQLDDKIRELQIQNEKLFQKNQLLEQRCQQLQETSSNKTKELQKLVDDLKAQNDMYKNFSKENDFLVEQNLEFFKDSLTTEFEKKEYVLSQFQLQQVKKLSQELENLNKKHYEQERELTKYRDNYNDSQEQIVKLKQLRTEEQIMMNTKIEQLERELEKERTLVEKIQNENDQLLQQNTELKEENKYSQAQQEIMLKKTEKYELMLFGGVRGSQDNKQTKKTIKQGNPNTITSRYVRLRYE